MKKFIKSILAITLLMYGFSSYAQVNGGVNLFEVSAAGLSNGKILVNSGTSTTIKFRVQFFRKLNASWYQGSSVPKYVFSNFTFRLSTPNASGGAVTLSSDFSVTNADFGTDSLFVSKVYQVTINQSDLTIGNNIYLLYRPSTSSLFTNYNKSYGWVLNSGGTTNPPGPQLQTYSEGQLVRTPDQKVYSVMNGLLRHIVDANTLYGVYNYQNNIVNIPVLSSVSNGVGSVLGPNTYILRDMNNDMLYFAEGNYLRYITSPAVANKYHLRVGNSNPNIYFAYGGVSAYIVGPPLY